MPITGKPGIGTVRDSTRSTMGAIDAIRARIEAIEAVLRDTELTAGNAFNKLNANNASLSFLQSQINQLVSEISVLTDLLSQDDGLVVLVDGELITRELEAGDNITIDNPDGADGNPIINSSGGGYPFLTTELDDDLLTEDGHRIRTEA
jgi:hypothetical protein